MTQTLITSQNTPTAERRVRSAFRSLYRLRSFQTTYEHGQWWVLRETDDETETYSAHDASGPGSDNGIGFERLA